MSQQPLEAEIYYIGPKNIAQTIEKAGKLAKSLLGAIFVNDHHHNGNLWSEFQEKQERFLSFVSGSNKFQGPGDLIRFIDKHLKSKLKRRQSTTS